MRGARLLAVLILLVGCKKGDSDPPAQAPPEPRDARSGIKVSPPPKVTPLSADAIGKAAGAKATTTPDGVVRISWARTDVPVRIDGAPFPAAAGLGTWAAFQPVAGGARVMGDTVVFQDEITPAIDAAFAAGLKVTALHNHFIFDDPPVFFMHIGGRDDPIALARAVKRMWDAVKKVRATRKQPARGFGGPSVKPGKLDSDSLAKIVGRPAVVKGQVVKVTLGHPARMLGTPFSGSMGLTTWAAFRGGEQLATIDGDLAMTEHQVQPVLRALRAAKIHVVALHNHMIGEYPPYYFVHFWGKGPAKELARGFKSALDAQRKAP